MKPGDGHAGLDGAGSADAAPRTGQAAARAWGSLPGRGQPCSSGKPDRHGVPGRVVGEDSAVALSAARALLWKMLSLLPHPEAPQDLLLWRRLQRRAEPPHGLSPGSSPPSLAKTLNQEGEKFGSRDELRSEVSLDFDLDAQAVADTLVSSTESGPITFLPSASRVAVGAGGSWRTVTGSGGLGKGWLGSGRPLWA